MEWGAGHTTEWLEALNALFWGLRAGLRQVGKHEDLSSILCTHTHTKKPSTVTCTCKPRAKVEKTGGSLGFTGQSAQPSCWFKANKGSGLKRKEQL